MRCASDACKAPCAERGQTESHHIVGQRLESRRRLHILWKDFSGEGDTPRAYLAFYLLPLDLGRGVCKIELGVWSIDIPLGSRSCVEPTFLDGFQSQAQFPHRAKKERCGSDDPRSPPILP